MGFWSGFEGLTGHQPGAFKGFSLKDIIDKDKWERIDRKFPSPRYAEEGLPAPQTAWYKGMGRPEMMGPRVGAADVSSGAQPRMGVGRDRPFPITPRQQPRMAIGRDRPFPMLPQTGGRTKTFPYIPTPRAQATNLLTPSWEGAGASADRDVGMGANRFLQLGDPRNIRSGPDLPPASMVDKTIVKKTFADPAISDTVTETIKEKVPTGSAQWGNSRHPPNWLQRMDEGYFGRPRSEQAANWQPDAGAKAKPMWGLMDWYRDLARRRHEEAMRARGGY